MMAIFTLGADEMRIRQMQEIASAWGYVGKYTDSKKLLDDAIKKKIAYEKDNPRSVFCTDVPGFGSQCAGLYGTSAANLVCGPFRCDDRV